VASPIDAVTKSSCPEKLNGLRIVSSRRCATPSIRLGSDMSVSRIVNSSPPRRATLFVLIGAGALCEPAARLRVAEPIDGGRICCEEPARSAARATVSFSRTHW
jgi:hypothetical protein